MDAAIVDRIRNVIGSEADALAGLRDTVDQQADRLVTTCRLLVDGTGIDVPGRLVVTGIGKAGLIGQKISATFASTGTPSIFLHPTEARHGDLGMVRNQDVILALSNSGSSDEVLALLPSFKHIGCRLIAIVGRDDSPLAEYADITLCIGRLAEACPLGLAPSTSTTAMLALGDALALTVQEMRAFTPEQYARFHPGGALGRKLMTCREAMRSDDRLPLVAPDVSVLEAMRRINAARAGCVILVDSQQQLIGVFTDGDLRRCLIAADDHNAMLARPVRDYATVPCRSIAADDLLQSALRLCARHKFNEIPVIDQSGRCVGLLDIQDLADRGFEV